LSNTSAPSPGNTARVQGDISLCATHTLSAHDVHIVYEVVFLRSAECRFWRGWSYLRMLSAYQDTFSERLRRAVFSSASSLLLLLFSHGKRRYRHLELALSRISLLLSTWFNVMYDPIFMMSIGIFPNRSRLSSSGNCLDRYCKVR
jgi:hypothetical protein